LSEIDPDRNQEKSAREIAASETLTIFPYLKQVATVLQDSDSAVRKDYTQAAQTGGLNSKVVVEHGDPSTKIQSPAL